MGHDPQHSGLSLDRLVPVFNGDLQLLIRFNSSLPYQTFKLLRPTTTALQELPAVRESGYRIGAWPHFLLLKLEAVGKFDQEDVVRMEAE